MNIPAVCDGGDFPSLIMVGLSTIMLGVSFLFSMLEGVWHD